MQIISISRSLLFGQSLLRQPQLHRKPTQAARWTWTRSVPFGSEQFAVKYKIIVQLTTMTVDVIQTNTVCKGVVMPKKTKGACKAKLTMRKTPEIFQQRLNTIPAYSSCACIHNALAHKYTTLDPTLDFIIFIHKKKPFGYACAMAALPRRLGAAPAGAATNASEATFRSAKLPENKICRHFGFPKNCKLNSNMLGERDFINFFTNSSVPGFHHHSTKFISETHTVTFCNSTIDMQIKCCTCQGMPIEKRLELLRQRLSTIQTCSCTGQGQVR